MENLEQYRDQPFQWPVEEPMDEGLPMGTYYPLNSRRLAAKHLRNVAQSMGISPKASVDEIRQMLEGQLIEMGREPCNVQVIIHVFDSKTNVCLADETGVFQETGWVENEEEKPNEEVSQAASISVEYYERKLKERDQEMQELLLNMEKAVLRAETLQSELSEVKKKLQGEKVRSKQFWSLACRRAIEIEKISEDPRKSSCSEPEGSETSSVDEINPLKEKGWDLGSRDRCTKDGRRGRAPPGDVYTGEGPDLRLDDWLPTRDLGSRDRCTKDSRRGKAPPVDVYTGEGPDLRLDDWLPTLERAASWNGWSEEEKLLQLAGYLRGRALQEWNLLGSEDRSNWKSAVSALRTRIDSSSKVLAAQDFRHIIQQEDESVTDCIRRLERSFQIAYGPDEMSNETRDVILHGQLQEALHLELMKSPAVSGAQTYKELCLAAKNEEKRLAGLKRRQQYQKVAGQDRVRIRSKVSDVTEKPTPTPDKGRFPPRRCYNCNSLGHLAHACKKPKQESNGSRRKEPAHTKVVRSTCDKNDPMSYLLSGSESEPEPEVRVIRLKDEGSKARCVSVQVQGVPMYGIVDSGADITIMGGQMFKKVATISKLKKKDFQRADKVPHTYDQRPFRVDGKMELTITFDGKCICTPIYIKMDASDQLLLSEGVCRQLGILTYHPQVEVWRGCRRSKRKPHPAHVRLVNSVRLLPHQRKVVDVIINREVTGKQFLLVEPLLGVDSGVIMEDGLIQPTGEGSARVVLSNTDGFTCQLDKGTDLGRCVPATVQSLPDIDQESHSVVRRVFTMEQTEWRQEKLIAQLIPEVSSDEQQELCGLLEEYHDIFSLEEGERGETDMLEMSIDTGDAVPHRQPVRRLPFAVRAEVAHQLREMQRNGVIQPSFSPWSSPIVLVRKKDGSLRFCVDYRQLNSVTKPDTFPLPRISDLLDQLGRSRYFSTLDLASGFWQIRVEKSSREKTAFVTHQGLFQFNVMPFGLTNAPSVFQRLMQGVLMGLNPEDGPDFVSVYIDDVLVFSETFEDHWRHLKSVFQRLREANLCLKPSKCRLLRKEVQYLGHVITPGGLRPNPERVEAVQAFPTPRAITQVRQFLGLASYYRRFISRFAAIAQPLHDLTRKGASFVWTPECELAFTTLKQRLIEAPLLRYPEFDRPFHLETDASIRGLGAILSQKSTDGRNHPVAYASRALSPAEKNYSISELETLAVVWSISRFHHYLYGHSVTVVTDHSAVKAILGTPSPNGKHARWWTKVYGNGLKSVEIVYRPGKENLAADALSRNPPSEMVELGPQVSVVNSRSITSSNTDISQLLSKDSVDCHTSVEGLSFAKEQRIDPFVLTLLRYVESGELPDNEKEAKKVAALGSFCTVEKGVLYFIDPNKSDIKRAVVPLHLRGQIMKENHSGPMAGHFSGNRLYRTLMRHWWWEGMYRDTQEHSKNCPQCAIVVGTGRRWNPPLHPIPVERPFQIVGVDIMDLPITVSGNKHVVVFQDFLSKWPLVFPVPNQLAIVLAKLLVEELVPMFGVPEALLSDRGTNLLSQLMYDVCDLLGTSKLNTTAYHPQCDGMVERFNRTLKTMIRKHVDKFGAQWDTYLPGLLWAYRNTPHESTGEKPSYLLFGRDLRSPTEAALLPTTTVEPVAVEDYREQLVLSISHARTLAVESVRAAQLKYKSQYDKKTGSDLSLKIGDWVLVKFPQEESGRLRKLSRPWHGPFRVQEYREPNVTVTKVYFPDDGEIKVHLHRVCICPPGFPIGYYWYGSKRRSPGRPPRWVENLLNTQQEPITEEPITEEPIIEEPIIEEPITEEPIIEAPITEGMVLENPVVVEEKEPNVNRRYPKRQNRKLPSRYRELETS